MPNTRSNEIAALLDEKLAQETVLLERRRAAACPGSDHRYGPDSCPLVRESHGRLNALADLRTELVGKGLI